MKKLVFCFLSIACLAQLHAQQDSTRINLGRLQLQKNFIQGVTIKGKDLEQLTFASLSDVTGTWLNGSYTNRDNIQYVVDGLLIADPNLYHISDIESITLVQNALVQLNGAYRQQQLVIVQLKKGGEKKKGWKISGQSANVTRPVYDYYSREKYGSYTNYFHNYNVSGYEKNGRSAYGLSMGVLRDVMPKNKRDATSVETPDHFNRLHGNAFYTLDIAPGQKLEALVNYLYQPSGTDFHNSTIGTGGGSIIHNWNTEKDHFIHGQLTLHSRFNEAFSNELSLGYGGSKYHNDLNSVITSATNATYTSQGYISDRLKSIGIQNSFRWEKHLKQWMFSPAVNLSYRHLYSHYRDITVVNYGSSNAQAFGSESKWVENKFLATPSAEFSYRDQFSIQGGFLYDFSDKRHEHMFPFVTAALSPSALFQIHGFDWKLFGSYAKAGFFADAGMDTREYDANGMMSPYPNLYPAAAVDSEYYDLQAGTTFGLLHGKIEISYNYDSREYLGQALRQSPWGSFISMVMVHSKIHRVGLTATIVDGKRSNWRTGLTATSIHNRFKNLQNQNYYPVTQGDDTKEKRSWTGGWNNRWQFGKVMAGADLAYHIGKMISYYPNDDKRRTLLSLQNVFIGVRTELHGIPAEFSLNGRNIFQDKDYIINLDGRRYLGAGFQLYF